MAYRKNFGALLVLCLWFVTSAWAASDMAYPKSVVRDARGQVVKSIEYDNCVRTNWDTQNGVDRCEQMLTPCYYPRTKAPMMPPQEYWKIHPCAKAPVVAAEKTIISEGVVEKTKAPKKRYVRQRDLAVEDRTVYFDFDGDKLSDAAKGRLDSLASILNNSANVRDVSIVGYADKMGAGEYNLKLSKRRASAVQDYLASRGYLDTTLAKTRGLGEATNTDCDDKSAMREAFVSCLGPDRRVKVEVNYFNEVMVLAE